MINVKEYERIVRERYDDTTVIQRFVEKFRKAQELLKNGKIVWHVSTGGEEAWIVEYKGKQYFIEKLEFISFPEVKLHEFNIYDNLIEWRKRTWEEHAEEV